jgi:hypothetical protein
MWRRGGGFRHVCGSLRVVAVRDGQLATPRRSGVVVSLGVGYGRARGRDGGVLNLSTWLTGCGNSAPRRAAFRFAPADLVLVGCSRRVRVRNRRSVRGVTKLGACVASARVRAFRGGPRRWVSGLRRQPPRRCRDRRRRARNAGDNPCARARVTSPLVPRSWTYTRGAAVGVQSRRGGGVMLTRTVRTTPNDGNVRTNNPLTLRSLDELERVSA